MRPIVADIGLALWRLGPANPIVVRVVTAGSKRLPHLWLRVTYLLILLFVMLIMQVAQSTSGAGASLGALAKSSSKVFEGISVLQLAMMCLLAPIFTAGAISQEKDAETFNVLLTTPLTNAQIALGSLMSRMFFVISLLLSGVPIFCITMLFGGVTTGQIFLSFGIAACTAVLTGSLAILISVVRVGTRGTIFSFYLGIAAFLAAGLALGLWSRTYVPESIVPSTGEGMSWLAPFHPFLALAVALQWIRPPDAASVQHYTWPLDGMAASPHTAYMLITLVASLILVSLATVFVRRGIKQGERAWWWRVIKGRVGGPPGEEQAHRPRRVWANPVAWREAVTRASAAGSNVVRYSYLGGGAAAALIVLVLYVGGGLTPIGFAQVTLSVIVIIEFVSVLLMAANTAATAITREREAGTMELLLSTPLTSQYILWGKLRGLIGFTLPLMAVPAATVLAAAVFDLLRGADPPIAYVGSALVLPLLLLVYSTFVCIVGLHMSLKCTRSIQAVLATIGVLVGVSFGLGLCGLNLLSTAGAAGVVLAPLTFVTAVWLAVNPAELATQASRGGLPMSVTEAQWCILLGTLIAVGLYGAIAAGTYRSMKRDFDMIVRKQSS